ncbi:MAG: hypothetical protein WC530_06975 [Candidatus Omnitrophota bacterium]
MTPKPEHDQPETGPVVTVMVDNAPKSVHRGHYIVSEFKTAVGVDSSRDLDEIVKGQIKPLQDADNLVIKGGEVFISHVKSGASS